MKLRVGMRGPCEFCSNSFTQKANLNMHMSTHMGEKPFQGHLYGKTSAFKPAWTSTSHTQTGKKPYCSELGKQHFMEKGLLLRHLASHH